ncbi:MAG: hypothetical protein IKM32_03315 [Clostridia bacterium]|nr:hypothetical protein [Clostridia bacterium]
MKRILALILAVFSLLLAACSSTELTENGFIDTKTGIEYIEVEPMGLYPIDPSEEFLTVKSGDSSTVYYEVWFEDTSRFLCYETEGYYFLVRSTEVKEPSVTEFNPIAASIYAGNNTVYIDSLYANPEYLPEDKQDEQTVGESELCKLIAKSIEEGEAVEVPVTEDNIENHYSIRLLSADYPGLYYLVSFFKYNGRCFLRDDRLGKTVYSPYDVNVRMVGGAIGEDDDEASGSEV